MEVTFQCAVCGETALVFELMAAGAVHPKAVAAPRAHLMYDLMAQSGDPVVIIEGPAERTFQRLDPPGFERLRVLLLTQDPAVLSDELFKISREYVPSYCPECRSHYCHRHWALTTIMEEGWYECTVGQCPKGH